MHTPDFTRRFVRCAHYTLGKAGDAGVVWLRGEVFFGEELFEITDCQNMNFFIKNFINYSVIANYEFFILIIV